MRVRVIVRFMAQHHSALLQRTNDERVRFKHLNARIVGNFLREFAATVDRNDEFDAIVFTHLIVVFTETWCHVHHASSIFGSDKLATKYAERTSMIGEIWKQWRVSLTDKFGSANGAKHFCPVKFLCICSQSCFCQYVHLVVVAHAHVVNIWCYCQCKVARQCPWRSCPRQQVVARFQHEANRECRVLHHFVRIVHARLGVRQWSFECP